MRAEKRQQRQQHQQQSNHGKGPIGQKYPLQSEHGRILPSATYYKIREYQTLDKFANPNNTEDEAKHFAAPGCTKAGTQKERKFHKYDRAASCRTSMARAAESRGDSGDVREIELFFFLSSHLAARLDRAGVRARPQRGWNAFWRARAHARSRARARVLCFYCPARARGETVRWNVPGPAAITRKLL